MIQYIEPFYTEDAEVNQSKYGLLVYDAGGNEYRIDFNQFNELEVTANGGRLLMQPLYSNQVLIKTSK